MWSTSRTGRARFQFIIFLMTPLIHFIRCIGLHAYVDTPQVVLTQPEGGTVRRVDNVSWLTSTRNSFYPLISTSTSSGMVGSKHLAISNVSIFSEVELLPNLWAEYPSTRGVVLRNPADSSFNFSIHECVQEKKAEEDLLESSIYVAGDIASLSLSSEDDDTEYSEDAASSSSSPMSSPTSSFAPLTSSLSSSTPTWPSASLATCPEDDEHSFVSAYKPRLPSLLSSCRSLFCRLLADGYI